MLPPKLESQEIHGAMGQHPEQGARADIEFGDTAHSRPSPRLRAVVQSATNQEYIFFVLWRSRWFDGNDVNGEFQFGLAYESDFAIGFAEDFMHVALVDFSFRVKGIDSSYAKERVG